MREAESGRPHLRRERAVHRGALARQHSAADQRRGPRGDSDRRR